MAPNTNSSKERGSVLVVCIGVLAILSLMAVAFLTTMQLQKAVSKHAKSDAHAEIAAQSGLAEVLAVLVDTPDDFFSVDQPWFEQFNERDQIEVFPSEYGISASNPIKHRARSFWRAGWSDLNSTGDGSINTRYAAVIVDLTSMLSSNCPSGKSATWKKAFATFSNGTESDYADTDSLGPALSVLHLAKLYGGATGTYLGTSSGSSKSAIAPWGATATELKGGINGPSDGLSPLNLNTAPDAVISNLIQYVQDLDSLTTVKATDTSLNLMVKAADTYGYGDTTYDLDIINALQDSMTTYQDEPTVINGFLSKLDLLSTPNDIRKVQTFYESYHGSSPDLSTEMETAVNDALQVWFGYSDLASAATSRRVIDFDGNSTRSSSSPSGKLAGAPEFYAGSKGYFYIVIRAQAGKGNFTLRSEKCLEAVFHLDLLNATENKIIYQRWFTR
ncbi:MAG: hypothetical protein ACYTGH_02725 [Planctomycetota bacterium]|jgi:hypothetical protein